MSIPIYDSNCVSEPSQIEAPPIKHLVAPGDTISGAEGFMRGHGTHLEGDSLCSSVAGVIERVNQLITVKPVKSRYVGEIGDVVVGRITEVQGKRWKVETNSRLDSALLLSSVNLPGGELRRKSHQDELMMRDYLQEGDLISAEVQQAFGDGSLSLHTRSLKYGKLAQGILIKVSPSLIKRRKSHFHHLPCGACVILGCNGYIFIGPPINQDESNTGGFIQNLEPINQDDRQVLCRLRNCVHVLAVNKIPIFDTSLLHAFESSSGKGISDLLKPEICNELGKEIRLRMALQESL